MLTVFKKRPSIVVEAQKAKFKPNIIIQTLIFIVVFFVSQLLVGIPIGIYSAVLTFRDGFSGNIPLDPLGNPTAEYIANIQNEMMLPSLILTFITTIVAILYCKLIEKRSLYSMGFVRKKAVTDYLIGAGLGVLMLGLALLISFLCGTVKYEGFVLGGGIGLLLLFLLGFILQGMSEEVLVRGYYMISVSARHSILLAVISNSVIFALLHILNNGIDVLPLINLTLFGIFASLYTLKTNSIWGICALHTTWNFAQGNIFGIRVSGIETPVTLFSFSLNDEGSLINGGSFGLEGGLAVTIVLVLGTIILLSMKGRGLDYELVDQGNNDKDNNVTPEIAATSDLAMETETSADLATQTGTNADTATDMATETDTDTDIATENDTQTDANTDIDTDTNTQTDANVDADNDTQTDSVQ